MTYEKLVGDKVPDTMRRQDLEPVVRQADSMEEYEKYLWDKLWEEVDEFLEEKELKNMLSESGDILGVIDAILKMKEIARDEVFSLIGNLPPWSDDNEDEPEMRRDLYDFAERLSVATSKEGIILSSVAVIDTTAQILRFYGMSLSQALQAEQENHAKRGGFDTHTIMLMERPGKGVIRPKKDAGSDI